MDLVTFEFNTSVRGASGNWYRTLNILGSGRNATTFLVIASSGPYKGVTFAMKVFHRFAVIDRRNRFLEEVAFLKTCSHPSIVRVVDDGIYVHKKGKQRLHSPFVVEEYLPLTFREVMNRKTSTAEKLNFTLQLFSALAYLAAMREPIVHRDIKPDNIFVKGSTCVLGDFGLLKKLIGPISLEDRSVVKDSLQPGPNSHRSPDLVDYCKGKGILTGKSDVFQLGLVVAELFSGECPLAPAETYTAAIMLKPLAEIPSKLGPGIAALIRRMLQTDPEIRESAQNFLDPLQSIFADAVRLSLDLEGRVFS